MKIALYTVQEIYTNIIKEAKLLVWVISGYLSHLKQLKKNFTSRKLHHPKGLSDIFYLDKFT